MSIYKDFMGHFKQNYGFFVETPPWWKRLFGAKPKKIPFPFEFKPLFEENGETIDYECTDCNLRYTVRLYDISLCPKCGCLKAYFRAKMAGDWRGLYGSCGEPDA
jgi:hypothetical protein